MLAMVCAELELEKAGDGSETKLVEGWKVLNKGWQMDKIAVKMEEMMIYMNG